MVVKQTCPRCRGDRYVKVDKPPQGAKHLKCPECNGAGYKVQVVHHYR